MRILMLGNSFTFFNRLPEKLAARLNAEVVHHTRGGARLAEQLNPETEMGGLTQQALQNEKWDYVVLQEMSKAPVTNKDAFLRSVKALCEQIRANGAKPVLYVTWAYQKGGIALMDSGLEYEPMYRGLQEAYREAAEQNGCLLADVGTAFYRQSEFQSPYGEDTCHPNETGSNLAAEIIARTIADDCGMTLDKIESGSKTASFAFG